MPTPFERSLSEISERLFVIETRLQALTEMHATLLAEVTGYDIHFAREYWRKYYETLLAKRRESVRPTDPPD